VSIPDVKLKGGGGTGLSEAPRKRYAAGHPIGNSLPKRGSEQGSKNAPQWDGVKSGSENYRRERVTLGA